MEILHGAFTPKQRAQLEHQLLVTKHIMNGLPITPDLLLHLESNFALGKGPAGAPDNQLRRSFSTGALSGPCATSLSPLGGRRAKHLSRPLHCGPAGEDPYPLQCRRTDGKKWRCGRSVVDATEKYCSRHMHRGRERLKRLKERAAAEVGEAVAVPTTACPPSTTCPSPDRVPATTCPSPECSPITDPKHPSIRLKHSCNSSVLPSSPAQSPACTRPLSRSLSSPASMLGSAASSTLASPEGNKPVPVPRGSQELLACTDPSLITKRLCRGLGWFAGSLQSQPTQSAGSWPPGRGSGGVYSKATPEARITTSRETTGLGPGLSPSSPDISGVLPASPTAGILPRMAAASISSPTSSPVHAHRSFGLAPASVSPRRSYSSDSRAVGPNSPSSFDCSVPSILPATAAAGLAATSASLLTTSLSSGTTSPSPVHTLQAGSLPASSTGPGSLMLAGSTPGFAISNVLPEDLLLQGLAGSSSSSTSLLQLVPQLAEPLGLVLQGRAMIQGSLQSLGPDAANSNPAGASISRAQIQQLLQPAGARWSSRTALMSDAFSAALPLHSDTTSAPSHLALGSSPSLLVYQQQGMVNRTLVQTDGALSADKVSAGSAKATEDAGSCVECSVGRMIDKRCIEVPATTALEESQTQSGDTSASSSGLSMSSASSSTFSSYLSFSTSSGKQSQVFSGNLHPKDEETFFSSHLDAVCGADSGVAMLPPPAGSLVQCEQPAVSTGTFSGALQIRLGDGEVDGVSYDALRPRVGQSVLSEVEQQMLEADKGEWGQPQQSWDARGRFCELETASVGMASRASEMANQASEMARRASEMEAQVKAGPAMSSFEDPWGGQLEEGIQSYALDMGGPLGEMLHTPGHPSGPTAAGGGEKIAGDFKGFEMGEVDSYEASLGLVLENKPFFQDGDLSCITDFGLNPQSGGCGGQPKLGSLPGKLGGNFSVTNCSVSAASC